MVDVEKIIELVVQLGIGDSEQRTTLREEIRSLGPLALPTLNLVKHRLEGEAYIDVIKTIIVISDDLFAVEGKEGLDTETLKTIGSNAKKIKQHAGEEVYTLSVDALTRWGFEVPPVMVQKIRTCHVCGVKSTEQRVEKCGLHSCDKEVCKKDAHIISTRFGQFDGTGGIWFCTQGHHHHANYNHLDWN